MSGRLRLWVLTFMAVFFVSVATVTQAVPDAESGDAASTMVRRFVFGTLGSGRGQLREPTAIEAAADGSVYVVDSRNHRIVVIDSDGLLRGQFGSYGLNPGQFYFPSDIAVVSTAGTNQEAGRSHLAVIDKSFRVQFFDKTGKFLDKVKLSFIPILCAADREGNLWLLDADGNFFCIRVDTRKAVRTEVGYRPDKPTDFIINPTSGEWAVCERGHRLVRFFPSGKVHPTIMGSEGFSAGQFYFPSGICFVTDSLIGVVDMITDRIQVFDERGHVDRIYRTRDRGEFQSVNPIKIIMPASGLLVIVDTYRHRLIGFSLK